MANAPTSPAALTIRQRVASDGFIPAELLGIAGDGRTDDTHAYLRALSDACLEFRKPIRGEAGKTSRIATCLVFPDETGFVSEGGGFVTTHADFSSVTKQFAGQGTIVVLGNRCRFEGSIAHASKTDGYVYGLVSRGTTGLRSRGMSISGINRGSGLKLDSVTDVVMDGIRFRDGYLDITTSGGQSTAIEIDGDKTGQEAHSRNLTMRRFDLRRGLCNPAWAAVYTYQTDGLNVQNTTKDSVFSGYIEEFGELLDAWSERCVYEIVGKNAFDWGFKFIHGATDNVLRGSIDGSGLSLVTVSDGNIAPTARNTIHVRGRNASTRRFYDPGTNAVPHPVGMQGAINIEDHAGNPNKCVDNVVHADLSDCSIPHYGAIIQGTGSGNVIQLASDASLAGKEAAGSGNPAGIIVQTRPVAVTFTYPAGRLTRTPDTGTLSVSLEAMRAPATGLAYAERMLTWQKANGFLAFSGRVALSSKGAGGAGPVKVGGFPPLRAGAFAAVPLAEVRGIPLPARTILVGLLRGTDLVIQKQAGDGTTTVLDWSALHDDAAFSMTGTYPV